MFSVRKIHTMNTRIFRRRHLVIFSTMCAFFLYLLFPVPTKAVILGSDPGCESETTSNDLSPVHKWNAELLVVVCGDGHYQTTADFVVRLTSVKKPEQRNDVFTIENHGAQTFKPLVQWLSRRHLQIRTTGNAHGSGLLERRYKDITITYLQ